MPSPGMRGWYVELDEMLVQEFERLFPEHGAKTRLTAAAIVAAINHLTYSTPEWDNVSREARNTGTMHGGTAPDRLGSEGTGE